MAYFLEKNEPHGHNFRVRTYRTLQLDAHYHSCGDFHGCVHYFYDDYARESMMRHHATNKHKPPQIQRKWL